MSLRMFHHTKSPAPQQMGDTKETNEDNINKIIDAIKKNKSYDLNISLELKEQLLRTLNETLKFAIPTLSSQKDDTCCLLYPCTIWPWQNQIIRLKKVHNQLQAELDVPGIAQYGSINTTSTDDHSDSSSGPSDDDCAIACCIGMSL